MISFSNLIPISLYVAVEVLRIFQADRIVQDPELNFNMVPAERPSSRLLKVPASLVDKEPESQEKKNNRVIVKN